MQCKKTTGNSAVYELIRYLPRISKNVLYFPAHMRGRWQLPESIPQTEEDHVKHDVAIKYSYSTFDCQVRGKGRK